MPYNGGLLISNFGTDALEPFNQSGKGFTLFYTDDVIFVADVTKDDIFVNDLPCDGKYLYASVVMA